MSYNVGNYPHVNLCLQSTERLITPLPNPPPPKKKILIKTKLPGSNNTEV